MKTEIETLLKNKLDISHKNKLFLTYVNLHGVIIRRGYQVFYDNKVQPFSKIYRNMNDAIDKFIELKNGIR